MTKKTEIKCEIMKHIGELSTSEKNWTKELNVVKWNDNEPCFDIRSWDSEHEKCSKGITLTSEELNVLYDLLDNMKEV